MTRLLTLLLTVVAPLSLWAGPSLPEIERYRAILQLIQVADGPRSMQPLFDAAQAVQSAVMQIDESDYAWLEHLSDKEAAELQSALFGLTLHRGLDVHAEVDGAALLALANERGQPVDQAFFQRFATAFNQQSLPLYLAFTDRASPCVRFDQPTLLTGQYRDWSAFRQAHPDAYVAFVSQWLSDIEDVIAQGTCTCTQDQAPVEATMAQFVEQFPQTPLRNETLARLQQLKDRPYEKPVWCR